ncbi:Uncharacterised protein [Vibrio cholerae]|nr:Uncharacterised protein [Vibrio cholerae]
MKPLGSSLRPPALKGAAADSTGKPSRFGSSARG